MTIDTRMRLLRSSAAAIESVLRAAAMAQEVAALVAADVLQLANLVQTTDAREAEVVRCAVERARLVLGPSDSGEKH